MSGNQKERPGVMLYFDTLRPVISRLDAAQCGALLCAVMDYAQYGVAPQLDPMTGMAFDMLVPKIDRDAARYEESREQRRYAAYAREKKRSGEQALSIGEWRLTRAEADEEKNTVPSRPDNGPLPSTSTTTPTTTTPSATPSASTTASPSASISASPAAAGEGSRGEGEARRLYEQWLQARNAKDRTQALKLEGRLYFLGYQIDSPTGQLRRRPTPH